ncbi:BNR repeat-like domain-containing protein [Chitinophaga ginsengisegetis]|uniref:BNR repeat-like domain-containing protein n=1 Tax=Chitinophaga ginsengisegetis TaxID=393003 RepID=A0A1T5P5U1_9BACT|nr:sialidase family protein [Chitinophaga ginsengisegetis]SKD07913.1 BNR repeat-like domain-containing protein [Chitinophaga ginsengisegetis]
MLFYTRVQTQFAFTAIVTCLIFILLGCKKEDPLESYDPSVKSVTIIYDTQDPIYNKKVWQGIPTIELLPNKEIWTAWYSGGNGEEIGNYIVMAKSMDDGVTWKKNVVIVQPNAGYRVFDPCLWVDNEHNKLHLYWAQCFRKSWDGVGGVWNIERDVSGITWSSPKRLANGVMMNKPTLINKEVVYPIAYWNKVYDFMQAPQHPEEAGVNVYRSQSDSLLFIGKIGIDKTYEEVSEHQIVELKDGRLWALIRSKRGIYESYSADTGRTWEQAQFFKRCGPAACSRFHIRKLSSGRLILIMNNSRERTNLTAFLSADDGKTWPYKMLIDDRNEVSYPDASEDKDGTIYVVYDRERYKAKEILMVKLTEKMIIDSSNIRKPQIKKVLIDN